MMVSDEDDARYHQVAFKGAIATEDTTSDTIYQTLLAGYNVIVPMSLEIEFTVPDNIPMLYSHSFMMAAMGDEEASPIIH